MLLKTNFCGSFMYTLHMYLSVSTYVYASKQLKITGDFQMTKQFYSDVILT